jgi:hypothetical protein
MRPQSSEQELIDIMFQVALMCAERMHDKSREEVAEWVAAQLRDCGFDTVPCGASWGVLK